MKYFINAIISFFKLSDDMSNRFFKIEFAENNTVENKVDVL